jgi:hypothetical protein
MKNTNRAEYLSFWKEEGDEYSFYLRGVNAQDSEERPYFQDGISLLPAQEEHTSILASSQLHLLPRFLEAGRQAPKYDGTGLYSMPEDIKLDRCVFWPILRPMDLPITPLARPSIAYAKDISAIFIPSGNPYTEIPESLPNRDRYTQSGGASGGGGASGEWEPDGEYFLPKIESFSGVWEYAGYRQSYPIINTYYRLRYAWVYDGCDINPQYHIIGAWDRRSGEWGDDPSYYTLDSKDISCCNTGVFRGFQIRMASYTTIYVCEVYIAESSYTGIWYPKRDATPCTPRPGILGGLSGGGGASGEWENQFLAPFPGKRIDFQADYKLFIGEFPLWVGSSPIYL